MKIKIFFLILLIPFTFIFYLKYKVSELTCYNEIVQRNISDTKDKIRILKADWAYLNSPQRLKRLAVEILGMGPIKIEQIKERANT